MGESGGKDSIARNCQNRDLRGNTMDTVPPPIVEEAPEAATAPPVANEDKTVAIVAYLTLIGFIVAAVIHNDRKSAFGAYHLRQALGQALGGIVLGMVWMVPLLGWLLAPLGWIVWFVLSVIGLIAAINGQQKPVPLLGPLFQEWFGTLFD
jgi:uncharacterized membrane protein